MTSKQVSEDNEKMSDTMYKLLKKYQAIRSIVKILHVSIDNLLSTKMFGKKLKKSFVAHAFYTCFQSFNLILIAHI